VTASGSYMPRTAPGGVRWRFRAGAPRVTGECRDLVKSRAHRVSDLGEGPGKQGNREVTSDRLGLPHS